MRAVFVVLMGLLLVNCLPPGNAPLQCTDSVDGGNSCIKRSSTCGDSEQCRASDPDEPFSDCTCVEPTPCGQTDALTCSDGGCASGETCGEVAVDPSEFTMPATTSPAAPLATPLTDLAEGDVIVITATGSTQYGPEIQSGCNGTPDVDPHGRRSRAGVPCAKPKRKACNVACATSSECAVADGFVGQPIAKIGNGPWFPVDFGVIHRVGLNGPDEHGALVVAYNEDGDVSDNTGSYDMHVNRVTGCACGATTMSSMTIAPAAAPAGTFTAPDGTFELSTKAPGRSAVHTVTFESGNTDVQGYSATITYPDSFGFEGFTAIGPVNTRVGTYAMDFDFDGDPDYQTWIRSTDADGAYADIDLSGTPTANDAVITRTTGNAFTVVAPNGGDQDAAQALAPLAQVTITLVAGILVNPPDPGDVGLTVTVTGVDPETGGADDGQGTAPASLTVQQMVSVGCTADADCDDADACTIDECDDALCSSALIPGIPGAVCALDTLLADGLCGADPVAAALDAVIDGKVAKAKTLLGQADGAKPKKRIATIKKAEKQLVAAGKAVKKAGKKSTITPACGTTLTALLTEKRAVLTALRSI